MQELLLNEIWDILEPDLQDALLLAYNQSKRDGRNIIKTRDLFASLARLRPEPLTGILDSMPQGALPEPVSETVLTEQGSFEENPYLSGCIQSSLSSLSPKASPESPLTSTDIFIDLVKYGKGGSVATLRANGVTPEVIEELAEKMNLKPLQR